MHALHDCKDGDGIRGVQGIGCAVDGRYLIGLAGNTWGSAGVADAWELRRSSVVYCRERCDLAADRGVGRELHGV